MCVCIYVSTITILSFFKSDQLLSSMRRMIVCNQVMKFILDKIEKDEKQAAKKRKKEEVVEQKRSKQNATKLTALLYKHKEQLKAEILKKRALLDKELQLQVQVNTLTTFHMMFRTKIISKGTGSNRAQ